MQNFEAEALQVGSKRFTESYILGEIKASEIYRANSGVTLSPDRLIEQRTSESPERE